MAEENLSKKEKRLAKIVAALVFLAFFYSVMVEPIAKSWIKLDREILAKKSSLRKNLKMLSEDKMVETQYAEFSKLAKASHLKEEDATSALVDLEKIAKDAAVFIVTIRPQSTRDAGHAREIVLSVSAEAEIDSFSKFLYEVEKPEHFMRIKRFTVVSASKESRGMKCTFLISKLLIS